tara:strand:+ start:2225 stop:3169 length:945 start_codon:yes stop_codon:yes gene_type:complete
MSTLSTGELLFDVLEAFKVRFPLIKRIGTDLSSGTARFNEQITARIASLPTVRDYDATTGYKANAANANGLTVDVPVTLNRHKHVPVKIDYIDQISTRRNLYEEATSNLAYQLGKEAFDYILTLIVAANFSQSSTFTVGNSDMDMLNNVTKDMNTVGASPIGRFGVVNSSVFESLQGDSRIASGDYHGQLRTDNAYGHLKNVGGFSDIYEYPDLPSNSENLTGFFSDSSGVCMASRLPRDMFDLAESLGIDPIGKSEVMTDEETGLSLMAIKWQESGTFDLYTTIVWLYGVSAGSQGGSTGDLTDYGLHRLVSA